MSTDKRGKNHPFFSQSKNGLEVIAHRGGGGEWPEETTRAFDESFRIGVDVLEMDLHKTDDDVLVLMHDNKVDRTTDGTGYITKLNFDGYIENLDAAAKWPSLKGTGIKVPTLKEVFTRYPNVRMNIEIKQKEPPLVDEFCQLIKERGKINEVLVASFSNEVLQEFRSKCPGVATSASPFEVGLFVIESFINGTYKPETDAIQIPRHLLLVPQLLHKIIKKAKQLNLVVHVFTVNKPEEMATLSSFDIDGIITDNPTTLLKFLGRI